MVYFINQQKEINKKKNKNNLRKRMCKRQHKKEYLMKKIQSISSKLISYSSRSSLSLEI